MAEVEIGIGKSGRRAYGFDDIAIVPSRRTRDPEDVDISWEIDAFTLRPAAHGRGDGRRRQPGHRHRDRSARRRSACSTSRACGPATRIPSRCSRRSPSSTTTRRRPGCRRSTPSRSSPSWSTQRIREIKDAGVYSAAAVTPQRAEQLADAILEAELDLLVIQGTVVSAEHVSKTAEPLNLKRFIRELDDPRDRRRLRLLPGRPAPHAHRRRGRARRRRSGQRLHHPRRARRRRAPGHGHRRRPRRPHAPPRRDRRLLPRHRRRRHGHRRRHRQGHRLRRRRRDGRLAAGRRRTRRRAGATTGATAAVHPTLPRGARVDVGALGTLEEILARPGPRATTAGSTCSAPSAGRWPRPATRPSRSSRRPRSWSTALRRTQLAGVGLRMARSHP